MQKNTSDAAPKAWRDVVIEQFTQQAVPFAQSPVLSNPETNRLVISTIDIRESDLVLDVACGPGLITCAIAEVARHVTGIDITPAMIDQAKALQAEKRLTNLDWHLADVSPLPFRDSTFSVVLSRYSFHHFLHPKAVLAEMVRVCQPRGKVAVVDMFVSSIQQADALNYVEKLRDPSHARTLSFDELGELVSECGLRELKAAFYQVATDLEGQLSRSFPAPGDADKIRDIFLKDLGVNQLGLGAVRKGNAIHFAYPIVVLVARKD